MSNWTTGNMPSQQGRLAVITGATGGLGYQAALALAGARAEVVLTGRNAAKGEAALSGIRATHPQANIRYANLDLTSLASVRRFSDEFSAKHSALDLLINNAGVMMPEARHLTEDGFELQFGTNYLSHFALTGHLLPLLRKSRKARVVNLSSVAHRMQAAIHFDNLQWQHGYKRMASYGQSKLAMLMFAFELQRRSDKAGWGLMSNAAHPGFARTDLQTSGPNMGRATPSIANRLMKMMETFASHSAAEGTLPVLFAATSPDARPAGYYGPQSMMEMKGPVGEARIGKEARDAAVAARLWEVSEQLTGMRWPV